MDFPTGGAGRFHRETDRADTARGRPTPLAEPAKTRRRQAMNSNFAENRGGCGSAGTRRLAGWLRGRGGASAAGAGLVWSGLLVLGALACKASVQADANASGDVALDESGKPLRSYDRPMETPVTTPEPLHEGMEANTYALFGARHDLSYKGPKAATCSCLAVALRDAPADSAFQWELDEPRVEPASQWIIALSSNDVPCEAPPAATLGASYQGYVTDGNDVVVYVEALGEGRPMTSGAIIPRPKPNGAVFVEPTNAVYGKPLEGKGKRCRLSPPAGDAKPGR
jgi:hypothetical protein